MTDPQTYRSDLYHVRLRWLLLAFMSGSINAGGFMACHRFVTHVTGFATHFGVDLANSKLNSALGMLAVPVFFLLGSFTSGLLIDVRIISNKMARYDVVMLLVFLALVGVWAGGRYKFFGAFGANFVLGKDLLMLALLSLASGLQNASITSSTGAVIRTTHLTGLTTDLGIGLAKAVSNVGKGLERTTINNWIRLGLITAFVAGSTIGAFLFAWYQFDAFLLPAGIALYCTRVVLREGQRKLAYKQG